MSQCQNHAHHIHPSSVLEWSNWSNLVARLRSWPVSLSQQLNRFGTRLLGPIVTKGYEAMA
jgi:hypothetical protein